MALASLRVTELRRREHYPALQAAWNFNEAGGTSARDTSGNGRTLTVDGGMIWAPGHSGGGTSLENTAGVSGAGGASASWNFTSNVTTFTMMGWIRPTNLTAGSGRPAFGIWTAQDATQSTVFAIYAQRGDFSTPNVLQGDVRVSGGLVAVNGSALAINTWVHVALTYDGSTMRLYKNGVEDANHVITGNVFSGNYFFCAAPNSMHGQVDDIRIFGAALSPAEVITFMNNPVAP